MATRFVSVDRDTPLLLPPDLRDWVPADHLVHFILDAVEKTGPAPAPSRGVSPRAGVKVGGSGSSRRNLRFVA